MSNRLLHELSPYLKQHAENPVDWYPWGHEAFGRAVAEDKPVFLSIGYSACHWCHVMAHESFENAAAAEILNRSFICVKVDREERPDVDDTYMTFIQMTSGRGGWPMSVFLTPEKAPFFGGTYFPLEDRGEHPGFKTTLLSVERLWKEKKRDLEEAAQYYREVLGDAIGSQLASEVEGPVGLDTVLTQLDASFDSHDGGFGSAPKFPPHAALELLLSLDRSDPMALKTLEAMATGGIHDHVGGGFHRYSTDAEWHLPHFEKMLYDNALLLKSFSTAAPDALGLFEAAVNGIVSWMVREMRTEDGLFYSALDADSEGEEGKFYTWALAEALELPNGESFAEAYQFRKAGNFRDEATGHLNGANILHLGWNAAAHPDQLALLLEQRSSRVRPQLDDKALVGWNGLAISGLVAAGRGDLALECANALLRFERLPRYVSGGRAVGEGFLEDYAYFALGLYDAGLEESALKIGRNMVARFFDEDRGGFYATGSDHEELFGRLKPVFDQPIPSPNSAAIRVLVRMGDLERAERCLTFFGGWMRRAPLSCEGLFLAQFDFERSVGYSSTAFRVVGFDGDAVQVVLSLPKDWYLNPLENGLLLKGTLAGKRIEVKIVDDGPEVSLSQDLTLEYQLCSDRECLPVKQLLIRGAHGA